jgi:ribonuclease HII
MKRGPGARGETLCTSPRLLKREARPAGQPVNHRLRLAPLAGLHLQTEERRLHYLIGTDEAGYGPNLGPLTVAGTLWQVDDGATDLYRCLQDIVSHSPGDDKLTIADSKVVYSASRSINQLETSVLAILFARSGRVPGDWQELVQTTCSCDMAQLQSESWISEQRLELPLVAPRHRVQELGLAFRSNCESNGVSLLELDCRPVFAGEFNRGIDDHGNKATLLSSLTLELAAGLKRSVSGTPDSLTIVCDKHGGRSKYTGLLSQHLTDEFIWIDQESTPRSEYRWHEAGCDVRASFVARGESFLPTALSSMIAKYVREVFMELWNNFWQLRLPDLKATRGYPLDAKRFKNDIKSIQQSLGIRDDTIWRKR